MRKLKFLFAALLLMGGCSGVSRKEYLADREWDQQRQSMRAMFATSTSENIMEIKDRLEALEKKMDERRPCIQFQYDPMPLSPLTTSFLLPNMKPNDCPWCVGSHEIPATQERPNYPCPYCDSPSYSEPVGADYAVQFATWSLTWDGFRKLHR